MKIFIQLLVAIVIFSSCQERDTVDLSNDCNIDHIKTALLRGQYSDSLTRVLLGELKQLKPVISLVKKWPEEKSHATFSDYADQVFISKKYQHLDSLVILTGLTFSVFNYGWQKKHAGVNFNDLDLQDQFASIQKGYAGVCGNIADFFQNVLHDYGYQNLVVNAHISVDNNDLRGHVFNVVKKNDGKYVICDATFGIVYTDLNCRPLDFSDFKELLLTDPAKVMACKPDNLSSLFSQPAPCLYQNFDWLYDVNKSTVYYYEKSSFNKFIVQSERDIEDWEQSSTVKNTYLRFLQQKGLPGKWDYFYVAYDSVSLEGSEWLIQEIRPVLELY